MSTKYRIVFKHCTACYYAQYKLPLFPIWIGIGSSFNQFDLKFMIVSHMSGNRQSVVYTTEG